MSKLIKIEFMKLLRSMAFKVTLIICAVMCLINVGMYVVMYNLDELAEILVQEMNIDITGYGMFSMCVSQSSDIIMLTTIVICILIGGDFSGRTLQTQIIAGFSRTKIVISRLISSFVVLLIFQIVYILIMSGGTTLFIGFGREFTASLFGEMVISFLMSIFMNFSILSLYILIIFLFRSVGTSIGVTLPLMLIGTSVIQIFASVNETAQKIFSYTPYGQMYQIGNFTLDASGYVKFFAVGIVFFAVTLLITIFSFRKAELK